MKTFLIKDIDEKDWENFVKSIPRTESINSRFLKFIKKEAVIGRKMWAKIEKSAEM